LFVLNTGTVTAAVGVGVVGVIGVCAKFSASLKYFQNPLDLLGYLILPAAFFLFILS
jgi:purine-cytosine permease-like protein